MTQIEILREFKQMSIREQLETLRAALEIVESNFEDLQRKNVTELPLVEEGEMDDTLLALAGLFQASARDIGEKHDEYLGQNLKDDHA